MIAAPQRRRRPDPDTGRYRGLSQIQKDVNTAHARYRGPGERVNAELKNWRSLQDPLQPQHRRQAHRRSSDPHDRRRMIRWAKAHLQPRVLLRVIPGPARVPQGLGKVAVSGVSAGDTLLSEQRRGTRPGPGPSEG